MAGGTFEQANEIAVLSAGQDPEWQQQPTSPDPALVPTLDSNGVSLVGSLATRLAVDLREDPGARTATVTIGVTELTSTKYIVTINGTDATYDAAIETPVDAEDIIQGIASKVNAAVGTVVTATATDTDSDAVDDAVVIVGDSSDHYSIAVRTEDNTGTLAAEADAETAIVQVWALPAGTGTDKPTTWRKARGARFHVDAGGIDERLRTGGIDRVYGQIETISGGGDGSEVTYSPAVLIGRTVLS